MCNINTSGSIYLDPRYWTEVMRFRALACETLSLESYWQLKTLEAGC